MMNCKDVAYFKALFQHIPWDIEETTKLLA